MNYCDNCHNCQLSVSIDPKKCFQIIFTLSTSKVFRQHFVEAAKKYSKELKLIKKSYIIDIGSNDVVGLKPLDLGFKKF